MAVEKSIRRRVIVNFKNTPEDIALYEAVIRHSSISGYIKDVLRGVVNLDNNTTQNTISNKDNNSKENIDVDDILGGI